MLPEAAEVQDLLHLKKRNLDPLGDRSNGTVTNGARGGLEYIKPGPQWKCVGLKVRGKYDNDDWLRQDGGTGEWAIGFTPISLSAAETFDNAVSGLSFFNDININEHSQSDGYLCRKGQVFTADIELATKLSEADVYSDETLLIGKARLNPAKIRVPKSKPMYRIATSEEDSRVYGIYILSRNLRETNWDSIGKDLYREEPTFEEVDTSKEVESRLSLSSKVAREGMPILKKVFEDIGADLLFTEKGSHSDLDILPSLLQKGSLEPKISFTMKSKENYDEIFKDENDVISSPYIKKLRREIAFSANVNMSQIDIKSVRRGSVIVTGIGPRDLNIQAVENHLPQYKISVDARELKAILRLSEDDFDTRGDNYYFTGADGMGGIRGGMTYKQPGPEWLRIGLRVLGRYDTGNDDWLAMGGKEGEWAVGFHGPGSLAAARGIAGERRIAAGTSQAHSSEKDVNPQSENKGEACGDGAYFAEDIEAARGYAEYRGTIAQEAKVIVFQARLNPRKVRVPEGCQNYRIVPTPQDSRIYGICFLKKQNVQTERTVTVTPRPLSSRNSATVTPRPLSSRKVPTVQVPKNECMCDNCTK